MFGWIKNYFKSPSYKIHEEFLNQDAVLGLSNSIRKDIMAAAKEGKLFEQRYVEPINSKRYRYEVVDGLGIYLSARDYDAGRSYVDILHVYVDDMPFQMVGRTELEYILSRQFDDYKKEWKNESKRAATELNYSIANKIKEKQIVNKT